MKSTMEPWSSGMSAYPLAQSENSLALGDNAVPADAALLQPYFAQIREEKGALILNVHLPFCPSRCLSCDRVAVVEHNPEKLDRYIANLDRELALAADAVGSEHRIGAAPFWRWIA